MRQRLHDELRKEMTHRKFVQTPDSEAYRTAAMWFQLALNESPVKGITRKRLEAVVRELNDKAMQTREVQVPVSMTMAQHEMVATALTPAAALDRLTKAAEGWLIYPHAVGPHTQQLQDDFAILRDILPQRGTEEQLRQVLAEVCVIASQRDDLDEDETEQLSAAYKWCGDQFHPVADDEDDS
jgi:hypothetical protein